MQKVSTTKKFKVKSLGKKKCTVYDIQTEKSNKFFGNDILVHNSVYINLEPLVTKFKLFDGDHDKTVSALDKICQDKLQPIINNSYEKLAKYMNSYQKMFMDREAITSICLFHSKKKYILRVHDSEGIRYDDPKLKILGIEIVRSDTPEICRNKLKEGVELLMDFDEPKTVNFINNFKQEFLNNLEPHEIAKPKGVSNIEKWICSKERWKSGTPSHVKAAICHNELIDKFQLHNKYKKIQSGDKIKLIQLKPNNPYDYKVIAFSDILPEEFQLHDYIDKYDIFDKNFLNPFKVLTDYAGWNLDGESSLGDFFVF